VAQRYIDTCDAMKMVGAKGTAIQVQVEAEDTGKETHERKLLAQLPSILKKRAMPPNNHPSASENQPQNQYTININVSGTVSAPLCLFGQGSSTDV
jgi:hypothetical protein